LEVPDIVGSEEVTEKIAEDVQVGDFLYKSRVDFEDNKFSLGTQGYNTLKFAIFRGDLIAFGIHGEPAYFNAWRYKNGEWEDFAPGIKKAYGTAISVLNSGQVQWEDGFIIKDDKIYFTGGRYGGNNHPEVFRIHSWDGFILQGHTIQDVSAYPPVRNYDIGVNRQFRYGYGTNIYEASGIVHAAVGIESPYDSSGNPLNNSLDYSGIAMYTFDTSTNVYTPVNFSAVETNSITVLDYAEINNELYMFAGQYAAQNPLLPHNQNFIVWRWDPSTQYWNYIQSNLAYNIGHVYSVKHRELSDGHYVIVGGSSGFGIKIYKFNESTKLLEEYFYGETPGLIYDNWFAVDLFEVSSTKYFVGGVYSQEANDGVTDYSGEYSAGTYLGKLSGPTSSLSMVRLDSPLIDASYHRNNDGTLNTYSYVEQIDTITHEGKTHLVLNDRWEGINLYEFDPVNERFDRDYRIFVRNFKVRGPVRGMRKVEYNGKTFIMYSSHNDAEMKPFISRNSSVSGGFLPVKYPDIQPSTDLITNETWVDTDTSTLYSIHGGTGASHIYFCEYETSANQFMKLADPSALTLNTNDVWQIRSAELSGVRYFVFAGQGSPYMEVLTFSSGDFHSYTTPSGVTMQSFGADIKVFNNQLFLVASEYNSAITDAIFGWRLDSSGWTEIPFDIQGGFNYNGTDRYMQRARHIRMVEHAGDLYCALTNEAGPLGRGQLWKYNPSTSNWDGEFHNFGCDIGTPLSMDLTSFDGYIWMCQGAGGNQLGGSFYIYRYDPVTKEKIQMRKFEESNSTVEGFWVEMEGELYLSYNGYTVDGQPRWYKLSEFANEVVWRKTEDIRINQGDITQATGIALESGSKGETIKIRKVKR